jgi:hypothetical protein
LGAHGGATIPEWEQTPYCGSEAAAARRAACAASAWSRPRARPPMGPRRAAFQRHSEKLKRRECRGSGTAAGPIGHPKGRERLVLLTSIEGGHPRRGRHYVVRVKLPARVGGRIARGHAPGPGQGWVKKASCPHWPRVQELSASIKPSLRAIVPQISHQMVGLLPHKKRALSRPPAGGAGAPWRAPRAWRRRRAGSNVWARRIGLPPLPPPPGLMAGAALVGGRCMVRQGLSRAPGSVGAACRCEQRDPAAVVAVQRARLLSRPLC